MHRTLFCRGHVLAALLLAGLAPASSGADQNGWIDLFANGLEAWKKPSKEWIHAESVTLDPDNSKRLAAKPGKGILVNGPKGRLPDLLTKQVFGDLEAHVEFLIPKGSNSGVKFQGLYEIQILDSFGKKKLSGNDCGGIYPRAEPKPKYHHIDEGTAPTTNASRPAGEWQTLDMIFLAPRFDAAGKKIANAKFVKVVLNGQTIHDNVEVKYPTGANWVKKEIPTGPFLLQADHGPVAFRNVRVRPLASPKKTD